MKVAHLRGSTAIELAVTLPIVLMLGLGSAQFVLIYQAKHALDYALTQAARFGTVDHASAIAINRGLANGLAPYLYGASDFGSLLAAEAKAATHIAEGGAAGWLQLRQASPLEESFADWAVPALDAMGDAIDGEMEIPNDNLDNRRLTMQPLTGVADYQEREPVGRASQQSLADANLLRLELTYGVRLVVPVIGPIVLAALSGWDGCGGSRSANARCRFYGAVDASGRPDGRIPVRLSATVRMMSTARRSELTRARGDSPTRLASLGVGRFEPSAENPAAADAYDGSGRPGNVPRRPGEAPGVVSTRVGNRSGPGVDTGGFRSGFLGIGDVRPYPQPQQHPALCQDS